MYGYARWLSVILGCTMSLQIDQFSIGRALGSGRFGRVFLAQHSTLGTVALKVLSRSAISAGPGVALLQREIAVHASLDHQYVVRFRASFGDEKRVYVVLDYAAGGSLHSRLASGGALCEHDAAGVICCLTDAINYLHSKSIVHRDIKPENVLLRDGGLTPLLADFGFAAEHGPESRRTTLAGTLAFAAPEVLQIACGAPCPPHGPPADVWSLGVLAAELLAPGSPAFSGRSVAERLRSAQSGWTAPPGVSSLAAAFIVRCLCWDPAARPTARELLSDPWLAAPSRVASCSPASGRGLLAGEASGLLRGCISSAALLSPTSILKSPTPPPSGTETREDWVRAAPLPFPAASMGPSPLVTVPGVIAEPPQSAKSLRIACSPALSGLAQAVAGGGGDLQLLPSPPPRVISDLVSPQQRRVASQLGGPLRVRAGSLAGSCGGPQATPRLRPLLVSPPLRASSTILSPPLRAAASPLAPTMVSPPLRFAAPKVVLGPSTRVAQPGLERMRTKK